jgi:hypothetical protein
MRRGQFLEGQHFLLLNLVRIRIKIGNRIRRADGAEKLEAPGPGLGGLANLRGRTVCSGRSLEGINCA